MCQGPFVCVKEHKRAKGHVCGKEHKSSKGHACVCMCAAKVEQRELVKLSCERQAVRLKKTCSINKSKVDDVV